MVIARASSNRGRNDHHAVALERTHAQRNCCGFAVSCFSDHLLRKVSARRDKDRERLGIMLSLRDEVRGNFGRIAAFAGNYNLRRAGQHIDRAIKRHEPLCRCDIQISGPDNLVDARQSSLFRKPARQSRALRQRDRTP